MLQWTRRYQLVYHFLIPQSLSRGGGGERTLSKDMETEYAVDNSFSVRLQNLNCEIIDVAEDQYGFMFFAENIDTRIMFPPGSAHCRGFLTAADFLLPDKSPDSSTLLISTMSLFMLKEMNPRENKSLSHHTMLRPMKDVE
jgi:hypothetical protein